MDGAEGSREREALTLQQWMARSRKGSGQSSPTRVRNAGTSRPKSCRDRQEDLQVNQPWVFLLPPSHDLSLQGALGYKLPSLAFLLFRPVDIIHLSPGQVVRVCRYSCNELTKDNPKGKDVSLRVGDDVRGRNEQYSCQNFVRICQNQWEVLTVFMCWTGACEGQGGY